MQTFVVEIRDSQLEPLENVECGDIGPKLGFLRVDNGYLTLDNIKIPRTQMLMRYVQVKKDGTVIGLENKQTIKYGYGSMLNLRVRLTMGFALGYIVRPAVELYKISEKLSIKEE